VFEAIEKTKRVLSSESSAQFTYNYPTIDIEESIARTDFEQSSQRPTEQIVSELDATLARAGLEASQIDVVCCTGGTARLPAVENALAARFGREKLTQFQNFHSVIRGLSEHAAALI
jgi:hypothetical chaperone protein